MTGHEVILSRIVRLSLLHRYTKPGEIVVDPFCGVGTTCHAAMLLGRQGVGFEIDDKCMLAFCQLYKRIYHTSCPKFNEEVLPDSLIARHFLALLGDEMNAEGDVLRALIARQESLTGERLDVRASLLVATQMHVFRNIGYIFLKFCNDQHPFPKRSFPKKFVDQHLINADVSKADKVDRPDVDTFEGLFEMSERMKHHVDGLTFRAQYMRFNSTSERRNPDGGSSDCSRDYSDTEDEEESGDSDIESASDRDVPAETYLSSPGPLKIEHMHAAAQAQGSPGKVSEFEASVRGSDEAKKKKKRDLDEAQKLMQKKAAIESQPAEAGQKPEEEEEEVPAEEKKKKKKKRSKQA